MILNLVTNAFYAVNEKKKLYSNSNSESAGQYVPTVALTTKKKSAEKILRTVKDSCDRMPQKALDKIFQPFFTTKPTGQGMELGLSLAYAILKAHCGELILETKEK